MGLDISHDAFHGAYSAFNRFRQCVAEAMGGSYPPHYQYGPNGEVFPQRPESEFSPLMLKPDLKESDWYWGDGYRPATHPGLFEFFAHSDCDGEISPATCASLAAEMEELLPKIEALGWIAGGHIERGGGYAAVARRFIAGCRAAAASGEPMTFG